MKKDIYIIRNTINDKCYIGQSVDYRYRFRKHCETARRNNFKYKSYLYNAMNKLGIENFYVELLESQVEDYNEKEIFYIQHFNTMRPNGYNLAAGGGGHPNLSGIENHNAKITSQEDLEAIYDELEHSTYSLSEIAKHYGVSFSIIQNINAGETYKLPDQTYPIREMTLSKQKLDRLTYDLKYSNLSYAELGKLYNISTQQVKSINCGSCWHRDYLTYPIRRMVFVGNDEIYEQIQKDLLSTSISIVDLAKKYNCSQQTIERINTGKTHRNQSLQYPLRKPKLSSQDVREIHQLLLQNEVSINEISARYKVSNAIIKRMNSGATKKYRDDTLSYPLRKM